ncbi:MAG: hypothetical protein A3K19_04220 [Lentisphaerae bacterium RIFOXYB12_FULL_65_16]|nr:MAG: hypothetical protein A3K18_09480 [Lentisphaerae bacterium RIFOXYA12_64_32]OGV84289.1 MAG: hypothetical protein A3K19_04220 [Lentisphaerae bacterium RIFOXYB12_FULL_65_16]
MAINLTDNPFRRADQRPQVHVAHGHGAYENTRAVLAKLDLSGVRGKRVLLKPNVGRIAPPGSGITTHPQVVAAAMDAFIEAGAQIAVGESPIAGVKTLEAFAALGLDVIAHQRKCPLIDLDVRPAVRVPVPEGKAIRELKVCADVLEYDLVVSIPVMKMHMHTGVTLAIKNMKGCLWRRSKVDLHMLPPLDGDDEIPINVAIADLASVLRPHLAIIDGTVAMEGLGPSAGEPREMNVVVAGADAFAADTVACALMGVKVRDVAHLRIGGARGYGVVNLKSIAVSPPGWRKWAQPLARPPSSIDVRYPNITVLDRNACSACQSTLLLFLRGYGRQLFDYFPGKSNLTVAIGRGHADVPTGTLCLGNCTARHRDRGIYVRGCPPVTSEILRTISGKPLSDVLDGLSRTHESSADTPTEKMPDKCPAHKHKN